jgi:hypothetical protein
MNACPCPAGQNISLVNDTAVSLAALSDVLAASSSLHCLVVKEQCALLTLIHDVLQWYATVIAVLPDVEIKPLEFRADLWTNVRDELEAAAPDHVLVQPLVRTLETQPSLDANASLSQLLALHAAGEQVCSARVSCCGAWARVPVLVCAAQRFLAECLLPSLPVPCLCC